MSLTYQLYVKFFAAVIGYHISPTLDFLQTTKLRALIVIVPIAGHTWIKYRKQIFYECVLLIIDFCFVYLTFFCIILPWQNVYLSVSSWVVAKTPPPLFGNRLSGESFCDMALKSSLTWYSRTLLNSLDLSAQEYTASNMISTFSTSSWKLELC